MSRREFIGLVGGAVIVWPHYLLAQERKKIQLASVLANEAAARRIKARVAELRVHWMDEASISFTGSRKGRQSDMSGIVVPPSICDLLDHALDHRRAVPSRHQTTVL